MDEWPSLVKACGSCDVDAVQRLLNPDNAAPPSDVSALLAQTTAIRGWSPLHVVHRREKEAGVDQESKVIILLLQAKADVNKQDRDGLAPLDAAVQAGRLRNAKLLILGKANVAHTSSRDGRTCLHHAVQYGHEGMVRDACTCALTTEIHHRHHHHLHHHHLLPLHHHI